MKKEKKIERDIYAGCYGPKLSYAAIQNYLLDAFQADSWAEKNNPHERFATCIWGNAGCVLAGTRIRVRKVSEHGRHKIVDENPQQ